MNLFLAAVAGGFSFAFVLRVSEVMYFSPLAIFAPSAVPWIPQIGTYLAMVGFALLFMAIFYSYFSGVERLKRVPAGKCLVAVTLLLAPPLFIYGGNGQYLLESQILSTAHGLIMMCSPWVALGFEVSDTRWRLRWVRPSASSNS